MGWYPAAVRKPLDRSTLRVPPRRHALLLAAGVHFGMAAWGRLT